MIKLIIKNGRQFSSWKSQPTFSIEQFLTSDAHISDEMLDLYVNKAAKMSLIKFETDNEKIQMK